MGCSDTSRCRRLQLTCASCSDASRCRRLQLTCASCSDVEWCRRPSNSPCAVGALLVAPLVAAVLTGIERGGVSFVQARRVHLG